MEPPEEAPCPTTTVAPQQQQQGRGRRGLNSFQRTLLFTVAFIILSLLKLGQLKAYTSSDNIFPPNYTNDYSIIYETCVNNSFLPKNWCHDTDKNARYVGNMEVLPPKNAVIKHYNHNGYDKCLAGKNVVLIGDSRVRYQFMNLAAYLKYERFMKCADVTINPADADEECFVINERLKQNNWTLWYQESTKALQSDQQSSLCDCYRPPKFTARRTYENRFIKRSTRYGETNLIYLQNFQNKIRMNQVFPPYAPYSSSSQSCIPGQCDNRINAFEGDLNATLWNILPMLNATHAFINLGWEHLYGLDQQSDFTCVMIDFERRFNIKLFLISHPPTSNHLRLPSEMFFDPTKFKCYTNVLDRTSMTRAVPRNWYWDSQHVLSILNREFNHQMIEKLCPL